MWHVRTTDDEDDPAMLLLLSAQFFDFHILIIFFLMMKKRSSAGAASAAKIPAFIGDAVVAPVETVAVKETVESVQPPAAVDGVVVELLGSANNAPVPIVSQPELPITSSPSNRDKFMGKLLVHRVGCNLDGMKANSSVKLSFQGTVVVVYPPSTNPDRRYIIFMDENGSTGITVWNSFSHQFSSASIGRLVEISRMSISVFQSKKSLTMSKESSCRFVEGANPWWDSLLQAPVMSIVDVHSAPENTIVSVCGILGSVVTEDKIVRNRPASLIIMRIVDRTGEIEIRSWNSQLADFSRFRLLFLNYICTYQSQR